jgi:hypothetical protein
METHPGAKETHAGAMEAHPGAMKAHLGAVKATPWRLQAHPGALHDTLEPWRSPWSSGGSPWSFACSPGDVEAHPGAVEASAGQISTEHLKTSIQPFFATCRLPRYPEIWRCYRNRHTFLGPHWKRSMKSLDNLLTVTMRNTQLLHLPRKLSLSSYLLFFWGSICFSYFPPSPSWRWKHEHKSFIPQRRRP